MKKLLAVLVCLAGIGALVYTLAQHFLPFTCYSWCSKITPALKPKQSK
ncbi:hypothetical protein [Hydrogeniiclostridium mannosilyticum]|nr:hypothetical protein [Hydrogeniiclostridium mannosilyticum]